MLIHICRANPITYTKNTIFQKSSFMEIHLADLEKNVYVFFLFFFWFGLHVALQNLQSN